MNRTLFKVVAAPALAGALVAAGAASASAASTTSVAPRDMICISFSSGDHGWSQCAGSNTWRQIVKCSDGLTIYGVWHYGSGQSVTYCDAGATADDTSVYIV